jgi:hypothetical protein
MDMSFLYMYSSIAEKILPTRSEIFLSEIIECFLLAFSGDGRAMLEGNDFMIQNIPFRSPSR